MNNATQTPKSGEAPAENERPGAEEQGDLEVHGRKSRSGQQKKMKSKPSRHYTASVYPGDDPLLPPLPSELGEAVNNLRTEKDWHVWLLLQNGLGKYGDINPSVKDAFFSARSDLRKIRGEGKRIALIIDSLGGDAKSAYQLATLFRRYCGGFVAVVPRYAKSAASLLTIGADEIILGRCAELGPLDTQIYNPQRNAYVPVLDKVKA